MKRLLLSALVPILSLASGVSALHLVSPVHDSTRFWSTKFSPSSLEASDRKNLRPGEQEESRRRLLFHTIAATCFLISGDRALAEEETATPSDTALDAPSITACQRSDDPSVTLNCVSTSSVKQLDLYAPPWTFNGMTKDEVMARLKGVIAADSSMILLVEKPNYLKVQAGRSFYTDELELSINEADEVVTFRSSQVSGPMVSDFGANRKRLEEIRVKAKLGVMGQEYELADPSSEGALGQLKAFYGLQSGEGFEDIDLDR
jgi:uncharacterized protein (DUF1499 family)